jgi:hypothetical protein
LSKFIVPKFPPTCATFSLVFSIWPEIYSIHSQVEACFYGIKLRRARTFGRLLLQSINFTLFMNGRTLNHRWVLIAHNTKVLSLLLFILACPWPHPFFKGKDRWCPDTNFESCYAGFGHVIDSKRH